MASYCPRRVRCPPNRYSPPQPSVYHHLRRPVDSADAVASRLLLLQVDKPERGKQKMIHSCCTIVFKTYPAISVAPGDLAPDIIADAALIPVTFTDEQESASSTFFSRARSQNMTPLHFAEPGIYTLQIFTESNVYMSIQRMIYLDYLPFSNSSDPGYCSADTGFIRRRKWSCLICSRISCTRSVDTSNRCGSLPLPVTELAGPALLQYEIVPSGTINGFPALADGLGFIYSLKKKPEKPSGTGPLPTETPKADAIRAAQVFVKKSRSSHQ